MGEPKYIIGENGEAYRQSDEQAAANHNTPGVGRPITGEVARAFEGARQSAQYVDENWGTAGKAAMGAVAGPTLGLGPAAMVSMGLVDRRNLEAAQESGAYIAGDVVGMLAPALLSGGAAAGARGGAGVVGRALARATPAGLMSGAGGLAERMVARMIPESAGILGKAASGTLKMAARGAAEGGLIASAHQASQDMIQNKPLAAQSILAAGAQGALFGGAIGGLLGGAGAVAGAGVDMVGGRVSSLAGGAGEGAAARALRHAGVTDAQQAVMRAEDASGSLIPSLQKYVDVLGGVEGLGQKTSVINAMSRMAAKESTEVAADVVSQLSKNHPTMVPNFSRMDKVLSDRVSALYDGTSEQLAAKGVLREARRDLGKMKTWENWTSSRDDLANRFASAPEGSARKGVYGQVLSAYDHELVQVSMTAADPALAKTYAAAVTKARDATALAGFTAEKGAAETGSKLSLNGSDAAILGFGAVGGTPLISAGIVAGKKISAYVQDRLEPVIAEYAARNALGATAASAQVRVGARINEGLQKFIGGARMQGIKSGVKESKSSKPSYSVKSYQDSMKLSDDLTSAAHQSKVRETTQTLRNAGHDELANEMALTYGRAVAYINATKPKGRSVESAAGSLRKPAKDVGVSSEGMRFINRLHAMTNPLDAMMGGLERGDLSRDAVAAVKYVYPDIHQDIVLRASQQFMTMKEEGKFLPADKVAMVGTLLGAPVDSTLRPEFIAEVQKAHAANKGEAPDQGSAPEQVTDASQYQTPLAGSVA